MPQGIGVKEENSPLSSLLLEITAVVAAVLQVEELLKWQEAQTRIPFWLQGTTFFSEWDFWTFNSIVDDRTCFSCNVLDKIMFTGLELRLAFPYLEIIDENTILAHVHPNCRCLLTRITSLLDYTQLDIFP